MARGTVKWFNAEKGFGFISRRASAGARPSTAPQLDVADHLTAV